MTRFFVSYSRSVQKDVKKVVDLLRAAGHEVWWDTDIPAVHDWWATILDNIEWCEVFLFVVSEKSVQSPYCLAELKYANDRKRPILPFVVDDHTQYTIPAVVTPMRNQWFVYDGDPAKMLDRIMGACEKLDWSKYEDIEVPRPPEPNTGSGSVVKQFQQAVSLAEDGQFEEALSRFRNIASLDGREWGDECGKWERRVQSYRLVAELSEHTITHDRARAKWSIHTKEHGMAFDPLDVADKLKQPTQQPAPPPVQPQAAPPPNVQVQTASTDDIYAMMDTFYAAYSAEDWGTASKLLHTIERRDDVPGMFDAGEYRTMIENSIVETTQAKQNAEAAAREYPALKIMAKHESHERVRAALIKFRAEYPDYDPDNLWEQFRPQVTDILPEPFEWCHVPAGEFLYSDNNIKMSLPDFWIAKYPITYRQFQTFIDDAEGFKDSRWWEGLAEDQNEQPGDQKWKIDNHPRENVSWYDAIAFCRWLSWRLGESYDLDDVANWAVHLPTEYEWEKAARGTNGLKYPYGNKFDAGKSNTEESGFGKTTPVTQYPAGASPYGVMDMSGNVREWCLEAQEISDENLRSDAKRMLRGGSFASYPLNAHAAYRFGYIPVNRDYFLGFRICRPGAE